MTKVWHVFWREFVSTVWTKAFLLGAVILPVAIYGVMFAFMAYDPAVPQMTGKVVIVDGSQGQFVAPRIMAQLDPEKIDALKAELQKFVDDPDAKQKMMEEAAKHGGQAAAMAVAVVGVRGGGPLMDQPTPDLEWEVIPQPAEDEREALRESLREQIRNGEIIAFLEVNQNSLIASHNEGFVTFYSDPGLESSHIEGLKFGASRGALEARLKDVLGLDPATTQLNVIPVPVRSRAITEQGEEKSDEDMNFLIAMGFLMLLWISTMTGGQYLLTTTVEEKGSKIMEVLLSATSAMQLMTGKILGQGAVAAVMLLIYMAMGVAGIRQTDFSYLVSIGDILIFIPYFIMAFAFIACMMAAIGAAVNDMREAQAMMGPAIMILIIPMLAFLPIIKSPNGIFATSLSFIPPMTPFVMAMRLGGSQAIPTWQIAATLVVGFIAVFAFIWIAAKIFRVGVLMYGKPPDFKTLVKWIWAA